MFCFCNLSVLVKIFSSADGSALALSSFCVLFDVWRVAVFMSLSAGMVLLLFIQLQEKGIYLAWSSSLQITQTYLFHYAIANNVLFTKQLKEGIYLVWSSSLQIMLTSMLRTSEH